MAIVNDTTMTIRVNSDTKKEAQELFSELGLDMSTAVNMFLKASIRKEAIPFEVSRKEVPNYKTAKAIKRSSESSNMIGPFDSVEEVMAYLDA